MKKIRLLFFHSGKNVAKKVVRLWSTAPNSFQPAFNWNVCS